MDSALEELMQRMGKNSKTDRVTLRVSVFRPLRCLVLRVRYRRALAPLCDEVLAAARVAQSERRVVCCSC